MPNRRGAESRTGAESAADAMSALGRFVRSPDARARDEIAVTGEQLLDRLEHQVQEIAGLRARLQQVEEELESERTQRQALADALDRERSERDRAEESLTGERDAGAREQELEIALERAREDVLVWRTELGEAWATINTLQQRLDGHRRILRRKHKTPESN
jgi:chromosome segregation ATPase